ncbi:hypothetical protein [Tenacibaculum amylolyticum]|uniref:hypothetical protein n=1 Tax=Tenacibaculum amylolyticum TaxID=104269 RepID=UPI003894D4F6
MVRVITVAALLFMSFFYVAIGAQNANGSACTSPEYQQFDFWVGDWNVYDVNNKLIGTNTILAMPNACAIQENWTSQNNASLGTSYSYYDNTDKKWHQLWIDNKGYVLATKGKFEGNKMILSSDLVTSSKGDYYNRITWIHNADGTVTQIWDFVSPKNKILREAFRGIYKKKKS